MNMKSLKCRVCGRKMQKIPTISKHYVFSDCNLWNGHLPTTFICGCQYIGKKYSTSLQSEISTAYENYNPFYQANGIEQSSIEKTTGKISKRSEIIRDYLISKGFLIEQSRALDFGCGNGPMLKAINALDKDITLVGADLGTKHKNEILQISDNSKFVNLMDSEITGSYEVITLIHVLEHLEEPKLVLSKLSSHLTTNGVLLIQVPNIIENPFDLQVIDHVSHFTLKTLVKLVENLGFTVIDAEEIVSKEITILVSKSGKSGNVRKNLDNQNFHISSINNYLKSWVELLENHNSDCSYYIFGTSIAASWLFFVASEIGVKIEAFVDEDESRINCKYFGKDIISLLDFNVKKNANIYIAISPKILPTIEAKIKGNKMYV